jgi:5-methylcytosine-specific restriction endonuclease McrA
MYQHPGTRSKYLGGTSMFSILSQKRCSKCGEVKSLDEFPRSKNRKDGHHSWCKTCHAKNTRAWQVANPQKVSGYIKKWVSLHPDKMAEKHRKTWLREKEKNVADPDYARKRRERNKTYSERHPGEWAKRSKLYREAHPEKRAEWNRNRRALKKNSSGRFTSAEFTSLKELYQYTCLCCGKREPEIKLTPDHILPLSKGGSNTIDNIQPLCLLCNLKKGTKHIDYRGKR